MPLTGHAVDFSAVEIKQATLWGGCGIGLLVAEPVSQCRLKAICILQSAALLTAKAAQVHQRSRAQDRIAQHSTDS